jgi:hypothetical protein
MIRTLLKLGLLLIVAIVVYNYFFGTSQEKEQSRLIFKQVGSVVSSVSSLVKSERHKFDAGKYDNALDKLGDAYRSLRGQADYVDKNIIKRLDELEKRKTALQEELEAIDAAETAPKTSTPPPPPKKGIKKDPKEAEQTAAKAADQQRRKEQLQRRLDDLLRDSEQLMEEVQQ